MAAFHAAQEALSFTDAIDALKDAMSSGWMKTYEYMFGNLDEARVLWTDFANALIEFSDIFTSARNELLKGWHELGGYKAAIEAVSNAWAAFMNIAYGVRDALASLLPDDLPQKLVDISEHFRDITASWKETFGIDTELEITKEVDILKDKAKELDKTLERGAKNDYVKTLQEQLIKSGYLKDKKGADGIYGPKTQEAVRKLQKALGVDVTGAWDKSTRAAAIAQKKFMSVEKGQTKVNLKNVEEVTEVQEKQIDHANELTKVLKRGAKGDEVRKLQEQLVRLGYLNDSSQADGIYGKNTEAAIKKLQKHLKVDVTGAWDESTMAAAKTKKTLVEVVKEEVTVYNKTKGLTPAVAKLQDIVKGIGSAAKLVGRVAQAGIKIMGGVLKMFKPLVDVGGNVVAMFGDMFTQFAEGIDSEEGIASVTERILNFFKPLGDLIKYVSIKINDFIKGYYEFLQAGRKENTFKNFLDYLLRFSKGNKLVESFVRLFTLVKNIVMGIANFVIGVFQSIFSGKGNANKVGGDPNKNGLVVFLQKLLDIVTIIINGITIGIALIGYLLVSLFKLVGKFIEPIAQGIGDFFSGVMNDFKKGKIKSFSDFFSSLGESFSNTKIGKFFNDTISSISKFFQGVKQYFEEKFPSVFSFFKDKWNSFKTFMTFDSSKGFFDNLKAKFNEIKIAVVNAVNNIKTKLLDFKNYIAWLFSRDENGKLNLFSEIASAVGKLKPILDKIIEFKDKFVSAVKAIFGAADGENTGNNGSNGPMPVLDRVKSFLVEVSNFDFGKYLLPAIGSLVAYGLFKNFKAIKNFSEGLAGLISGGIKEKDSIGTTALKIAGAVAALALSIGLLSVIDAGKAEAGVGVMISILAAFVGASALFGKVSEEGRQIGKQMLMLASSIGVLALGIWLMMKVVKKAINDPETAIWTVGSIIGIIAALAGVEIAIRKFGGKDAKVDGILQMCLGVGVIVLAIGAMTDIVRKNKGKETLGPAIGIIAGMIIGLGALEVLLARQAAKSTAGNVESKVSGVLQMCIGVQFLVAAFSSLISIVKNNTAGDLIWAAGILAGMFAGIYFVAKAVSGDSTSSKDTLIKAIALCGTMFVFSHSIETIANGMAEAINTVKNVDPWVTLAFFGGMAALIYAASQVIGTIGALDLTVMLKGVLGLVLVGLAVEVLLGVFAAIGTSALQEFGSALFILGSGITDFANMMATINWEEFSTISDYVSSSIKGIVGAVLIAYVGIDDAIDTADKLKNMAAKLKLFAINMSYFDENASANIGYAKAAVEDVKSLTESVNSISVVEGIDTTLTNLGAALSLYYQMIQGIGTNAETGEQYDVNVTKVDSQMISEAFTALKDAIPMDDIATLQSYAEGGSNDMTKVALGITAIGAAVKSYGDNVGGLDSGKIESGNSVISTLANLYTTISDADAIKNVFDLFGDTTTEKINKFSDQLVNIGAGMQSYIDSIANINSDNITVANGTIDLLADIANKLPKDSGFLGKLFGGTQSLGKFGSNMSTLGKGVANYANEVAGGDFTNVTESLGAVTTLAEIAGTLEKSGGLAGLFSGDKNLSLLSNGLVELGTDLNTFATNTADFKYEQIAEPFEAMMDIVGMMNLVNKDSKKNLKGFGEGLRGMFKEIASIYTDTIVTEEHWGFTPDETMPVLEAMSQLGKFMIDGVVSGIDASNGGEDGSGQIRAALMRAIIDAVSTARKIQNVYIGTGEFLIDGLIEGINNKYQELIDKLDQLGKDSAQALQDATEVASPSKLFYWIAEMWIDGLTNAVDDNKDDPINALTDISKYLVDSLSISGASYSFFDTLIETASSAAKKYKESANSIIKSNDSINRSTAKRPRRGEFEGLTKEKAEKIQNTYSDARIREMIDQSSYSSDRVLKRMATGVKDYGYSKRKLEDNLFSDYQKKIEDIDARITEAYLDPKVSQKEFWKYGNENGIRGLSSQRRVLQLEQWGYLDPKKRDKDSGNYKAKDFYKAYGKFVNDVGFMNGKGSLKFNATLDLALEDYLDKNGGIEYLIKNARSALSERGWKLGMDEFEKQYGSYSNMSVDEMTKQYKDMFNLEGADNPLSGGLDFFGNGLTNLFSAEGADNPLSGGLDFFGNGLTNLFSAEGDSNPFAGGIDYLTANMPSVFSGEGIQNAMQGLMGNALNGIIPGFQNAATGTEPVGLSPVFDFNSIIGTLTGGGETGVKANVTLDEASKINLGNIDNYSSSMSTKLDDTYRKVNSLINVIQEGFEMVKNKDGNVYLDGNALVGKIGPKVNNYLGKETARVMRSK